MNKELLDEIMAKYGPAYKRAWAVFCNIRQRCNNPRSPGYGRYGGRGIRLKISEEEFIRWYLENFDWKINATVDRKNNDGHYELGNLQILTRSENVKKQYRESSAARLAVKKNHLVAVEATRKRVKIGAVIYPSLTEAGRAFGKSETWIRSRLVAGHSVLSDGTPILMLS